jgi:hypothetical protein
MCPALPSDDPWGFAGAKTPNLCSAPATHWGAVSRGEWPPLEPLPVVRQRSFGGLRAGFPRGGGLVSSPWPMPCASDSLGPFKAFGAGCSPSAAAVAVSATYPAAAAVAGGGGGGNQAAGLSDQRWPAVITASASQLEEQRLLQSRLCLLASLLPPGGAPLLAAVRCGPDARPPFGGAPPAGVSPAGWDGLGCGGVAGGPASAPHPLFQALLQSILRGNALNSFSAGGERGFSL